MQIDITKPGCIKKRRQEASHLNSLVGEVVEPTPEETQEFADRKIVHLETWSQGKPGKSLDMVQTKSPAQPGFSSKNSYFWWCV